jgi:hypothetical protein
MAIRSTPRRFGQEPIKTIYGHIFNCQEKGTIENAVFPWVSIKKDPLLKIINSGVGLRFG